MNTNILIPGSRLLWICKLIGHRARIFHSNAGVADFVSECRICRQVEHTYVIWPRPER